MTLLNTVIGCIRVRTLPMLIKPELFKQLLIQAATRCPDSFPVIICKCRYTAQRKGKVLSEKRVDRHMDTH